MLRTIGRLLGGALAAAGVAVALAPGASAATVPKAVEFWGMPPEALAVRPKALAWTTDLGASFNGTRGSNTGRGPGSNLSWRNWSAIGATGSGDLWVPRESGVSISWKRYPATLGLSAAKTLSFATTLGGGSHHSSLVFTRVEVSFRSAVPVGWRRSAGFTLKRLSDGFYGFAFPG